MLDIEIRLMHIGDYDAVYALWLSCKGMGLNDVDDSREGLDRYLRRNSSTCFVALCDGKIVGVIMAGHDGRRGYIHHTAVLEAYRGCGVGKRLVGRALDALKEEGISKVALVVFDRNDTGNVFWEKQGFTTREDLIYRNKTLVPMVRKDT